jgi:tetratricopeptide (TPR) repeat protein
MAVSPVPAGDSPTPKKEAPPLLALSVVAVCMLVIGGVAALVVYPEIRAKYHWEQAKKDIANNYLAETENHGGAEKHLEECLKVWKTDGEVHFAMARVSRRIGKFDQAREHLQKAKQHNWVASQIKLENILLKAQTGYLPEATKQLEPILEEGHQDDVYILEALIIGCIQTNFLADANRWAMIWIRQHPDDWLAHYWHGIILEGANQHALAKDEYLKALELNPNGFDTHLRLAEVMMRERVSKEAMEHYEKALEADPQNASALFGLARCQQTFRSHDVTKATLDRLIELHPDSIGAYGLHSKLADEEDRPEEALQWLKKAQAIDPNDRMTNQKLVEILHQLKRDEEARQVERRIQEQERQLTRLDDINKELLNQPKDVLLRNEAGNILLQLGKPEKALHWFLGAFLIDRKDQAAKEGMGKCFQKMGDKELIERYRVLLSEQS